MCELTFSPHQPSPLFIYARLNFNFIQQKLPTSIRGEMNASFYQFSGGLNTD